jgi:hypothetical protein
MEALTFDMPAYIALNSDLETRIFLLHYMPAEPVQFIEFNFQLRATWQSLDKEESVRIASLIHSHKHQTTQMKFN